MIALPALATTATGRDPMTAANAMTLADQDLLARLVAFDTTSDRSNAALIDFVCDYAGLPPGDVLRMPDAAGSKINLLLRVGPDEPGGILLCGHVDCVPAREPDWASDPFALTRRDGRLVGRGAVDMKGFVALALNRLRARHSRSELRRPLLLLLTHDEEVGSAGAARFAREWRDAWPLPRDVIVGEPTGLRVVRMHKGHLALRFTLRGRPAHSGYPHLGQNAIERATPLLAALAELAQSWRHVRTPSSAHFPEVPYPVLNIATLAAGEAVNVVPRECVIQVGVRLMPGQSSSAALDEMHALIARLPPETRAALHFETIRDNPPMLCDKNAPANIELARLLRQCASVGVSYASDAGWLSTMGLNCVLFGPGRIEDAHQANEFILHEAFEAGGRWLDQIIERFCIA